MRLQLVFGLSVCLAGARAEEVSFQRDVWPVFKRHCLGCHSEKKDKGGLRMDDVALLLKGGKTGPLYVPGHPEKSLLISQVSGEKPEMPENEPPLTAAKVRLLERWIAQGAKVDAAPKVEVPAVLVPAVYDSAPAVGSVSLSPDGKWGAAACRSEVVVFELDKEEAPRRLPTEFDLITHVEFSPDGKRLLVSGGSPQQFGAVLFFDTSNWARESLRKIGGDTLFRGRFSPDGKTVAVGGAGGAIHLVPLDPKLEPRQLELHSDWVLDVAFTPDGSKLVSGSRDKTTKVSSVEPLQLLRSVDQSKEIISAVAATEQHAFSGGVARAVSGYEFKLALSGVEVNGSGNGAAPVNKKDQYTRAFEAQTEAVTALAMSGDRALLAVATRANEVRVYQADARTKKVTLPKVAAPVLSVALNRDGSRLLLGAKSGEVEVWDVAQAKRLWAFTPVPLKHSMPGR
jgi:WD40 repeat protein